MANKTKKQNRGANFERCNRLFQQNKADKSVLGLTILTFSRPNYLPSRTPFLVLSLLYLSVRVAFVCRVLGVVVDSLVC